jgi:predicted amidohydrolase YtcJ
VTHEYTLLVGGVILPGGDAPEASAIAWAGSTVLAIGSDAEVRAISRGDSHFVDLRGAWVIPLAPGGEPEWPARGMLEVGGGADMAVLDGDPRRVGLQVRAVIRAGRVVTASSRADAQPTAGNAAARHNRVPRPRRRGSGGNRNPSP